MQSRQPATQPDGILIRNLPFAAYQREFGINQSGLKEVLSSPAHYQYRLANPRPDTAELFIGRMVHLCVLEPEAYEKGVQIGIMPKQGKRRNEMTAEALMNDTLLITEEEDQACQRMRDAVWKNSEARRVLSKGAAEQSLWWQEPEFRVRCKARFDFISTAYETPICVDLKTARAGNYDAFSRDLVHNRYDLQACHYTRGGQQTGAFDPQQFIFIVVEKSPPYFSVLYDCGPTVHTAGFIYWEQAMLDYSHSVHTNSWPGPAERTVIEVPAWEQRKQEKEGG